MVPLSSAPARTLRWQLGEPVTLRRDQRAATSPRAAPGGRSCRCSRRALSPEADPGRERTLPPNGATDSRDNSWVNRTLAPRRVAPEALSFSHFLMVRGPNPVCRAMSPIEAPAFRKAWICACLVRCRAPRRRVGRRDQRRSPPLLHLAGERDDITTSEQAFGAENLVGIPKGREEAGPGADTSVFSWARARSRRRGRRSRGG